jgi:16S rRNA (guanine966-N2)-methyltransferase
MRIIAGRFKGRPILAPPTGRTRPILDRAKTVLFDLLGARLAEPGRLPPIAVLDLFAGTGTLGLEALSRGARYCRFVEQHHATARLLIANLDRLGLITEADVIEADATTAPLHTPLTPPNEQPSPDRSPPSYELIFVDPPYRMLAGPAPAPGIRTLLARLASASQIAPSALVVVRHELSRREAPDLAPLVQVHERECGSMVLRLLVRPDHPDITDRGGDAP